MHSQIEVLKYFIHWILFFIQNVPLYYQNTAGPLVWNQPLNYVIETNLFILVLETQHSLTLHLHTTYCFKSCSCGFSQFFWTLLSCISVCFRLHLMILFICISIAHPCIRPQSPLFPLVGGTLAWGKGGRNVTGWNQKEMIARRMYLSEMPGCSNFSRDLVWTLRMGDLFIFCTECIEQLLPPDPLHTCN